MSTYFQPWDDESDYVRNNYGVCDLGPGCQCIKPRAVWLGRICSHWRPIDLDSFSAMLDRLREIGKYRT